MRPVVVDVNPAWPLVIRQPRLFVGAAISESVDCARKHRDRDRAIPLPCSVVSLTSWVAPTARGGPSKCTRHNYACRIAPKVGGRQREQFSPAHRADQPTKRSPVTRQSIASASSPRTSASSAWSTAANYSNGSTGLPTPPPHSGVAATASPPPSATFTSTGPSASVNSSNCTPASSTPGAAVCTSLSPSTPAIPPGHKQFKPRNAQSFSSPSRTPAPPSRYPRGHRSPCLNCNDNGKRGSGYRCADASKAPWRPELPRRGHRPPRHAALPSRPHRRQSGRQSRRRPSHAVDRQTAYMCGADWTGAQVITSYIAGIRLPAIIIGDVIEVTARIITPDRAASTPASTSPPPTRRAANLTS